MNQNMPLVVKGHVTVTDDLGAVLLDRDNAVHPQNMSRIIARALSNEHNFFIHRIAFGNGGTQTNAAFTITYNTPNDGQSPDVRTWDSRLYHETYSEIINEGDTGAPNVLIGTDPGSSGSGNQRPGGGADPSGDPSSTPHVSGPGVYSNELGLTSEVVVSAVLNPGEPTGQFVTDGGVTDTESSFSFDEIGLYTEGAPAADSNGSQDIDIGNRTSEDDTGLTPNTAYSFDIEVDGGGVNQIDFVTPIAGGSGSGGEILYGDLCEALNTGDINWGMAGSSPLPGSNVSITDNTLSFPTITGSQTFGFLRFTSTSVGLGSTVDITDGARDPYLPDELNFLTGGTVLTASAGEDAGIQNDPTSPLTERERLLTHIIFSPVLKAANRTLTITYTLTIAVARSQ